MRSHRRHHATNAARQGQARAALGAIVSLLLIGWVSGCSTPGATNAGDGSAAPAKSSSPQEAQVAFAPPSAAPQQPAAPASAAAMTGAGDAGSPDAASESAAASPSASAAAAAGPVPNVKVTNIGMHIGGGKNDASEKDPIRKSVEPHFDELRRCFAKLEDQTKTGDVSVDLRVEKAGGKAKVTKLRTALKGKPFEECIRETFEAIDFRKPKDGTTNVSYSLRFAP